VARTGVPQGRFGGPSPQPVVALRTAAAGQAVAQADFSGLADCLGVDASGLALEEGQYGRGLFAARGFRAGETLLSVPLSCCLIVGRDYGMSLPGATWEQLQAGYLDEWPLLGAVAYGIGKDGFNALGWELRLMLAVADIGLNRSVLPEASPGKSGGGSSGGALQGLLRMMPGSSKSQGVAALGEWLPLYLRLLPEELPLPSSLPAEMLEELQDPEMIDAAMEERAQMAELLGKSTVEGAAGMTLDLLTWALAIVRSRAFDATPETFVLSPLIDLINHAWENPNAEVQLAVWEAPADEAVLALQGEVRVCAQRDIPKGAEVCFSYGCNTAPTPELFRRYGMIRPGGNPFDELPFEALAQAAAGASRGGGGASAHEGQEGQGPQGEGQPAGAFLDMAQVEAALEAAVTEQGERWLQVRSKDARLKAVIGSLARLEAHDGDGEGSEASYLAALADAVEAHLAAWPTSLAEDEAALASGADGRGDLGGAALAYRIERKRLWHKAAWVLGAAAGAARSS